MTLLRYLAVSARSGCLYRLSLGKNAQHDPAKQDKYVCEEEIRGGGDCLAGEGVLSIWAESAGRDVELGSAGSVGDGGDVVQACE